MGACKQVVNVRGIQGSGLPKYKYRYKLKYSGSSSADIINLFKQFVKGTFKFSSDVWHSSITEKQSRLLKQCQAVASGIILSDFSISY